MDLKENAKKLYEQGLSLKDISDRLSINYNTIKQWRSRYNWKKPVTKKKSKKVTNKVTVTRDKRIVEKPVEENIVLTEKQKLFAEIYIRNFNATQAAIKAGYSPDSAFMIGSENLRKPKVKEYIEQLKAYKKESIMINQDDIIERYMRIAFADMTDFVEFKAFDVPIINDVGIAVLDKDGNYMTRKENGLRLKDSDIVDGGLICEVSTSRQGTKIKLEDRQKALDWLAKFFEMNPEHLHKKEHDNKKLQLERERFDHVKDMDSKKDW